MKRLAPAIMLLLLLSSDSFSWLQQDYSGYAGEYLNAFSGGARGASLGLAGTGLDGKAELIYSNPASLASLWWKEASFNVTPLFAQGQFIAMSYGYPFNEKHSFGLSLIRLSSSDAEKTNALGETLGSFADVNTTIMAVYSRKLSKNIFAGGGAKFISQDIDYYSARGAGADAGLIIKTSPADSWGLTLSNIIPARLGTDVFEFVPKAGYSRILIPGKLTAAVDLHILNLFQSGNLVSRWFAGLEYDYPKMAHWRVGANQKQFSAGFGFSTRQIDFDYAIIYHPLDLIHSFTLTVRYGFILTEAEERVKSEWENLKNERIEFENKSANELERIRFEKERLKTSSKLIIMFIDARDKYEKKQYSASAEILEAILKSDPAQEEAKALLAEIRSRMNSETIVRRLKEIRANYKQGKYEAAMSDINYLLDIQPDNTEVRVMGFLSQAQLYLGEQKYNDAKGELIEVMKIDPQNTEASLLLKRIQTILEISQ